MIDGYTFTDGKTDVIWADGDTGVTFTLTSAATGPGDRDWSMTGNGTMDEQLLELHEEYPALFAAGGTGFCP
jgi:hypothetical protein